MSLSLRGEVLGQDSEDLRERHQGIEGRAGVQHAVPDHVSEVAMNEVEILAQRLDADLAPTGLDLELGVFDLENHRWLSGSTTQIISEDFGDEGFVVAIAGSRHLLPPQDDGGVDLVGIVEDVQDWVIDQLEHGWPELIDHHGQFAGLFTPERDSDGAVKWVTGTCHVPVGQLSSTTVSLPPRWGLNEGFCTRCEASNGH